MSTVVCLAIVISASIVGNASGAAPGANAPQYHPSAVRGQPIELEVQIPEVKHVRFQIDGMLENLFDHEAPFNFLIPTGGLEKGNHEWSARAYDDSCCVYGSTAGSIQIYPLPKVRAPVVVGRMSAGGSRLSGLVVSKVARGLTVRAWASGRGSAESLPLRLLHRHRSRRVYEFAHGITVAVRGGIEIEVEVAPAKRLIRHGVEVRGRLAQLRLRRTRSGSTSALQSAVTPCTTTTARKGGGPQPLPGPQSCASVPPTTPPVSIVCIDSMQCRPGAAARGRRG